MSQDILIYSAPEEVTHCVCEPLFHERELTLADGTGFEEPLSDSLDSARDLMEWLN